MKKTFPAFLTALLITLILGGAMFAIGRDALDVSAAQATGTTATLTPETLSQLEQALVQYQAREVQYQAELSKAIERLNSTNQQLALAGQQIQQYQSLLAQLQNIGLITINSDGTVSVTQLQFPRRGHDSDGDD